MTEFADNIKRLREEAGYSQAELAPRIGARMVSQTDWRLVESTLARIGSASVQAHAFRLWR